MESNRFVFIHIPKTGGRYVAAAMRRAGTPLYHNQLHLPYRAQRAHAPFGAIPLSVVRNPYTWLESRWNFFCEQKSWQQFVLDEVKHGKLQSSWLLGMTEEHLKNNVMRTETLSEDLKAFSDKYDLNLKIVSKYEVHDPKNLPEYLNSMLSKESSFVSSYARGKPDWTESLLQAVNQKYEADFVRFNYSRRYAV